MDTFCSSLSESFQQNRDIMEDIIRKVQKARADIVSYIDMYGQIVGAVHVYPRGEDESTIFFFSKGMTYATSAFSIQKGDQEVDIRFVGLKMALFTMEGFAEYFLMEEEKFAVQMKVMNLGHTSREETFYISFSVPDNLVMLYIKERPGYESFQNYLTLLKEDKKVLRNVFDKDWSES